MVHGCGTHLADEVAHHEEIYTLLFVGTMVHRDVLQMYVGRFILIKGDLSMRRVYVYLAPRLHRKFEMLLLE